MNTAIGVAGLTGLGDRGAAPAEHEARANGVYRELLAAIIAGDPAPGMRLKERELSERYSVSRMPVRQAIQRLEAEGFVVTEPHRGAVVRRVTHHDIEELFDARLCVEPFAARLAAGRIARGETDADALLRHIGPHPADADSLPGSDRRMQVFQGFHSDMALLSGNRSLAGFLRPVLARTSWIFRLTNGERERDQQLEHRRIHQALAEGNAELAASLAYSHIELSRQPVLEALRPILDR